MNIAGSDTLVNERGVFVKKHIIFIEKMESEYTNIPDLSCIYLIIKAVNNTIKDYLTFIKLKVVLTNDIIFMMKNQNLWLL